MSFPQFGRLVEVEEEVNEESFPQFGRKVSSPFSEKQSGDSKDIAKQLGIGGLRGLGSYGNILDLIKAQSSERLLPGQKAIAQAESEGPESLLPFLQDDDLMPHYSRLPKGDEVEDFLQMLDIDTAPKTPGGKTARRIGEGAVATAALGPTGKLVGAGALGGAVGGITEELTDSPLLGDVAEITTNIGALLKKGPQAIGKKGEKLKSLQALGFSPQEATVLSQGEGKLGFLGKLASKDRKTQKLFQKIFKTHSNLYDGLREASKEMGYLRGDKGEKLSKGLAKAFNNLTPGQQELGEKLVENFNKRPVTFKSMMDFVHDLNMKYGKVTGGKKALLALKKPMIEGMKDLNPEAGRVFEELQSSYKSAKQIGKKLSPKLIDEMIEAGELFGLAKGLISSQGGLIVKSLGVTGARKLAREFLINPELQGIMLRIAKATKEGKTNVAQSLARQLPKYLPQDEEELP